MKKLLIICAGLAIVSACSFHTKQPVDKTYYKNTQSVAWPDSASSSSVGVAGQSGVSYGVSSASQPNLNWQNPAAPDRVVPVPEMPEKKLQCVKVDRNSYTCRIGQYQCGTGCRADGSQCNRGHCLQSDCDDVLGQKWDLVYQRNREIYVCQHPTEKVMCYPNGSYDCLGADGNICGYECNKNGTQCARGPDTCWSKYRTVQ